MLVFKAWRKSPALTQETTPSQRRITRILSDAQQAAAREFEQNLSTVAELLSRGQVDRVVAMLPTEPWLVAQEALAAELLGELLDAGSRVTLPSVEKATVSYSFDRERPESSQWARQAAGTMISQITGEQRNVVRDVVANAALGELDWADVAQQVRGSIGLTTQQAGWVANHYNQAYLTAIRSGMGTAQARARATESASRYQTAVHRYRANTIARTETMRAASEGRMQAWNQGITEGFIGPNWQKEWVAEASACQICLPLNGKKVAVKGSFSVGEPPAHPNCRCDVILVPPKVQPAGGGLGSTAFSAISTVDDLILLGEIPFPNRRELTQWRQAFQIATAPDRTDRRTFSEILNDLLEPDTTVYADEGPRLTFEEIQEKADEIFDRGMAIAEEAGKNPLWEQDNGALGDSLLSSLYEYLGYDAMPTVLNDDEFEALARDNLVHYRGFGPYRWPGGELSPAQLMDFFRFGRYYPGYGVYGNGTYSATDMMVAISYAGRRSADGVLRLLISPTAKIARYDEVAIAYREWHDSITPEQRRTKAYSLLSDFGRWCAAMGYDAIRVIDIESKGKAPGVDDYMVVLNRGTVTVPASNGFGSRLIMIDDLEDLWDQELENDATDFENIVDFAYAFGYQRVIMRNGDIVDIDFALG